MLDTALLSELRGHLQMLRRPIRLSASLDATEHSVRMRTFLRQIADLSPLITLDVDGDDRRKPSFEIRHQQQQQGVRFAAIPLGHELTSLVLAMLWTGGHPPKADASLLERIAQWSAEVSFEVYMSLTCHNCPDVVQALSLMQVVNPAIKVTIIDGALYQAEVQARQVMAVPLIYLNGEPFGSGRMSLAEIVAKLDVGSAARDAARLNAKPCFDVLVIGGGPAGAAAAVYAARKGVRVGIVAERLGGQVNDTAGIENYISVLRTEGPKFALDMQAQLERYGVDIMDLQRVIGLEAGDGDETPATVHVAGGAALRARSVIVATGARWRELNVPGERQYRNKGVAYCPHCDGPLFAGKRVAVIGGGNSGVEAAIDLAGVVAQVTLVEFSDRLKADAVLLRKLDSLPNVSVRVNAQTLEVLGDGQKVTGLLIKDLRSGDSATESLDGVFVQIGLLPNTDWLNGALALNRFGEIETDAKGRTSLPGVFAAGDCTTTPYKQIVIAAGEGAQAALSAFDDLIRRPIDETVAMAAA